MNVGEEICGEWLRHLRGCDFVQYNVHTIEEQGEIDVVGINLAARIVYACEVAIHLVTGLQYTKDNQPDNVQRLTGKIERDRKYLKRTFPDYKHVLMLWSPVVIDQRSGSKHNQVRDVDEIVRQVSANGVEVVPVINDRFRAAIDELRAHALRETKEQGSSVMRFLQIEEHLRRHLARAAKRAANAG